MEKFTADSIFCDPLTVLQPQSGYRFSIDSIVLASHVNTSNKELLLDIGTGCGIMPLLLAKRFPGIQILGIEIQKELADFACQNVSANQLERQITIFNDNILNFKELQYENHIDVILSNPPYKKLNCGRLNKDSGKAIARHEIHLTLEQLCAESNRLLKPFGKFYLIFPAERRDELIDLMHQNHLTPETICFIHTKKNTPAKRIIVTGIKNGLQNCIELPPVYIQNPIIQI